MPKSSKQKVIFFTSVLALMSLSTTPADAKTLSEAISSAWKNHPSLSAAQATVNYNNSDVKEQYSAYFPQLNVSAYGGRGFGDNATSRGLSVTRGEGYSNMWEGNVALRQGIFDAGGRDSRYDAAKMREDSALLTLESAKDALAHSVTLSYLELIRVYQTLSFIKKHRASINDYIARIKHAVDNGAADEAEYKQALDIAYIWEDQYTANQTLLNTAKATYLEAVGEMPEGHIKTPQITEETFPQSLDAALAQATTFHPELLRAELDEKAAEHGIDTEEASLFPTLDGELSYLQSEKRDVLGGEVTDARALVRMNWAFDTGGSGKQRIAKSKYKLAEMQSRTRELKRQIQRGVRLAYAEYDGAKARLVTQKKRQNLAENLLQTSQEQFDGARISLLQLLQAEDQLFQMVLENLNARNQLRVSQFNILSSVGIARSLVTPLAAPKSQGTPPAHTAQNNPENTVHATEKLEGIDTPETAATTTSVEPASKSIDIAAEDLLGHHVSDDENRITKISMTSGQEALNGQ